jgi:hypothetical protein
MTDPDDRVAFPGDPDLDCHLTGLRLASVVATDSSEHDLEATLAFDTSDAAGWWKDSGTGERVFPERVTELNITFGVTLTDGFAFLAERLVRRLSAWSTDRALIAMTAAPGKFTRLYCPGHPAGGEAVIPRSALPSGSEIPNG